MSHHPTVKSLFLGSFIHSKSLDELEYFHDSAVCIDENGTIVAVEKEYDFKKAEEILFPKLGWSAEDVTVKIAKPGQFYFPGFIGQLSLSPLRMSLNKYRYTYSRLSIPERWYLWEDYFARLAEHLHFPHGKQSFRSVKSQDSLYSLYPTDALKRDNNRLLLRHHLRAIHQLARRPLPRIWPTSVHRPLLHGHTLTRLLSRRVSFLSTRRYPSNHIPYR